MYSPWTSIFIVLIVITSCCNGQVRAPKSTRALPARPSINSERTSGSRGTGNGNTVKRRPIQTTDPRTHDPRSQDPRSSFITRIDELHTAMETQKNVFVTHKRDFDNHISSIERRFSTLTQGLNEISNKMQVLSKKNIDLENQLKEINEQFVLVPKEKVQIAYNEDERSNSSDTQARSVSKSTIEDYLSNRGAELIGMMPSKINTQKQKVSQRTTTSARSGNRKTYSVNNNDSSNKPKSDYISDAMVRLFAQDKYNNDRLLTLEAQIKSFDLIESVTTTIIVEACNETDSTTEILELKDMEKRVSDLEKHIEMNNVYYDLKEQQTNKIGKVEARGKGKYKNEVFDSRAASDARKSLFSAARTTPFFGSDKESRNITFDHTYVNKGKHFVNNSTFVCHLAGFYFFTFTIRSRDNKTPYVTLMKKSPSSKDRALMKNGEAQTSISADFGDRNIMQSQSTILQLSEGDEVWLRVGPNANYALDSEETNKYITFTGFLIYKGS